MRTSKLDQSFAALEHAAERAHDESFAKTSVDQRTKARIATPLDRCEQAASDLERFLGHAAADAPDRALHEWLYDATKCVGAIPLAIREALASVEAFADVGGTAAGALRRAAFEARLGLGGRTEAVILGEVEAAFARALSVYDDALEEAVKAPAGFVEMLLGQRRTIARLRRELAARWPRSHGEL